MGGLGGDEKGKASERDLKCKGGGGWDERIESKVAKGREQQEHVDVVI